MATDVKELTVESSPTEILASMTSAERKDWRETGKTPELKEKAATAAPPAEKTDAHADSSPAAKTETVETKTDSAPVAEPSKSRGKNAETRIPELLSEVKRLNAELEALRKAPVAAPAKKEELAKPRRNDVDEKTGLAKYATDDDFLDARDAYVAKMASQQTRSDIAKEEGERRVAEQNRLNQQKWQTALKLATERHEDFAKVCEIDAKGAFQNAELKGIKSNSVLDAFILDSELGGSILYHLAKNPGEVARIEAMNAFAAARELTKLEEKLSGSTIQPAKDEGPKPPVTKAPAPATSTGGRATAPVDESEAAIKQGDFRRYMRAENEADWKAKKKAS
jgi:hypothetical protein